MITKTPPVGRIKEQPYWVIRWRNGKRDDWGWMITSNLSKDEITTQDPLRRKRWRTLEAAMVALWICRRDSHMGWDKAETYRLVRVAPTRNDKGASA